MVFFQQIRVIYNRLIDVPSADLDDARRRKLLNIILVGMAVVAIAVFLATSILLITATLGIKDATPPIVASLATVGGVLIFYFINRLWSGFLAGFSFLVFLMFVITLADSPAELANGRSVFLFAIPIVVASVLLGSTSTFIFYVLCSIEIIVLALYAGKPVAAGLFPVISFFFLTIISWLSSRSLEQALKDLREININLDKLVTERTRDLAEALTRERIEGGRNQAILNSIADGVVVFNANNMVMLVNPALSQLTDTTMSSLTGIGLNEFVQVREVSPSGQDAIMGLFQNPENVESGVRIDWGKKTLSVSIARVRDTATNDNIGTVAVFRDVTREAELEKMKETFVAVVSHELRTPLNAIMGFTEMLKESVYGPITERQTSITERIMVNTRRLLGMVGDLLDEAQIKAGKLSLTKRPIRTTSLLEDLHTTMDKIAADKGLYLTDEFDPNMPDTIMGDPQRLQQILVNLVNNSIKFTEKGGIRVRVLRHDADHFKIEVADTGSGIPEAEIPYIFESFRQVEDSTTRKHGGFGLGLSIVNQLVELLNGEIAVKSELNKGSTFTVTLPIERLTRSDNMENLAFVIEDDEDLAGIFTEALKVSGFDVETIRDGAMAQKRIGEASPEIIILDMHLPHVDGPALLTQIHADEHLKDTRIFLATADAQLGEFYRNQVDSVLIKPISFSQLRDLTARYKRK